VPASDQNELHNTNNRAHSEELIHVAYKRGGMHQESPKCVCSVRSRRVLVFELS